MENRVLLSLPPGFAIVDVATLQHMIESAVRRCLQQMPPARHTTSLVPDRRALRLPAINASIEIRRLCKFLARTGQYVKDQRYAEYCAKGLMQHSKLLKLSKLTADEFAHHIFEAIELGLIERGMLHNKSAPFYRLSKATAAQVQPQTPEPMPPLAPDDPEQDSDFWDLSKAIARAQAAKA